MGQKVHPYGFRVGYNKDWHSHWYTKQDFAKFLADAFDSHDHRPPDVQLVILAVRTKPVAVVVACQRAKKRERLLGKW